jgi:hypothetical protein
VIVVICDPDDDDALWLVAALSRRGIEATAVTPIELVVGSTWSLTVATDGTSAQLTTAAGVDVCSATAVINRMPAFPSAPVDGEDRDVVFAAEEVRAALVATFAAYDGPMMGRPSPYHSIGIAGDQLVWTARAAAEGVAPAAPLLGGAPDDAPDRVLVRALLARSGVVIGPAGAPVRIGVEVVDALRRLAADADGPIALELAVDPDGDVRFVGADPLPALRDFGAAGVGLLVGWAGS